MVDDTVEQATRFDISDVPDDERLDSIETKRQNYRRLARANRPGQNGQWRDESRATKQDNLSIIDAVASQLELTEHQKAEARYSLVHHIPDELLGAYRSALLALCICGVVARRDGRSYHPNHAHPNSDIESRFVDLFEDTEARYSKFSSCWSRVEREI